MNDAPLTAEQVDEIKTVVRRVFRRDAGILFTGGFVTGAVVMFLVMSIR